MTRESALLGCCAHSATTGVGWLCCKFTFYAVLHCDAKLVVPEQVVLGVYPAREVLVAQATTECMDWHLHWAEDDAILPRAKACRHALRQ